MDSININNIDNPFLDKIEKDNLVKNMNHYIDTSKWESIWNLILEQYRHNIKIQDRHIIDIENMFKNMLANIPFITKFYKLYDIHENKFFFDNCNNFYTMHKFDRDGQIIVSQNKVYERHIKIIRDSEIKQFKNPINIISESNKYNYDDILEFIHSPFYTLPIYKIPYVWESNNIHETEEMFYSKMSKHYLEGNKGISIPINVILNMKTMKCDKLMKLLLFSCDAYNDNTSKFVNITTEECIKNIIREIVKIMYDLHEKYGIHETPEYPFIISQVSTNAHYKAEMVFKRFDIAKTKETFLFDNVIRSYILFLVRLLDNCIK